MPKIIAPLWTRVGSSSRTRIWYHLYYKHSPTNSSFPSSINRIFKASNNRVDQLAEILQAVVITWENMVQYGVTNFSEVATIQLVIITTSIETYVNFYAKDVSWQEKRVPQGAIFFQCDKHMYYREAVSNTPKIFTRIATHKNSDSRVPGTWTFKIDTCSESVLSSLPNDEDKCNAWIKQERQLSPLFPIPCPCSLFQVLWDPRFTWYQSPHSSSICYMHVAWWTTQGRECCYDLLTQTLDTSLKGAGFMSRYNPIFRFYNDDYERNDLQPFHNCRKAGNLRAFFEHRDINSCIGYIPMFFAWSWGDPHIVTLDGFQYTFNGLGEYTHLRITNADGSKVFEIQVRTGRVTNSAGNEIDATGFTAIAAYDYANENARFQASVNKDKNGMLVWTDGIDQTNNFINTSFIYVSPNKTLTVSKSTSGAYVTSFTSGVAIETSFAFGFLSINIRVSPSLVQNRTLRGLMGNMDNNKTNEFVKPSGEILPANSTESTIFSNFGELWRTNINDSVFIYENGESHVSYQNTSFIPIFKDSYNSSQIKASETTCGGPEYVACIYDYLATSNASFAKNTKDTNEEFKVSSAAAENNVPTIALSLVKIEALNGQKINITGNATDVDNDQVTIYLNGTSETSLKGKGNASFTYSLTINDTIPFTVSFYAIDEKNGTSSSLSIPIFVCSGCSNGNGKCDYSIDPGTSQFIVVPCICDIGWTGKDCDTNINGCQNNPCPIGANCTDNSPAQENATSRAYVCSACPRGYKLDVTGTMCDDVDECLDQANKTCDQNCTNTLGTYVCSCLDGYRVSDKQCIDIDECKEGTSGCQQTCTNTAGSFYCTCRDGYTLNADWKSCTIMANLSAACSMSNCSQGCSVINNVFSCFCNSGFELDADNKTCKDINECNSVYNICPQVCNNTLGAFSCSCNIGYFLQNDKTSCEPCDPDHWGHNCSNNCTCSTTAVKCHAVKGCICRAGFTGPTCNDDINECAIGTGTCRILETCVNTRGSYACICNSGYERNETGYCININECTYGSGSNCNIHADCIDLAPNFTCQCKTGYVGDGVTNCTDIDECRLSVPCEHKCTNMEGSYNCECYQGYILNDDRVSCSFDTDPCGASSNLTTEQCKQRGYDGCIVTNASLNECFCNNSRTYNGTVCADINECINNNGKGPCSQNCINKNDGYECMCNVGYFLSNDQVSCEPCSSKGLYGTNCNNRCACGAGANNCNTSTGCVCKPGWTGEKCDVDVDECNRSLCNSSFRCDNTLGSYECVCAEYNEPTSDGSKCTDINECKKGTALCNQRCIDIMQGYNCSCESGYAFKTGSTTECENINECLSTDMCEQICIDTLGSYYCACNSGFILNTDLQTCAKDNATDPCRIFNYNCSYGCRNANGRPQCYCENGFKLALDNTTCVDRKNKANVTIVMDDVYNTAYNNKASDEYRQRISDYLNALKSLYGMAKISNYNDVGITELRSGSLLVEHFVVFDKDNVDLPEYKQLAAVLSDARQKTGYLTVAAENKHFITEPLIAGTKLATCLLCATNEVCLIEDVRNDTYSCRRLPNDTNTIKFRLEVRANYSSDYNNTLSVSYANLRLSVESTLRNLTLGLDRVVNVIVTEFRKGNTSESTIIFASLELNSTATEEDKIKLAQMLVNVENEGCLSIHNSCVPLLGAIYINADDKARCLTCSSGEICKKTVENGEKYSCVMTPNTPSDNQNLILGLGLGIPLFIIMCIVCLVFVLICRRRRKGSVISEGDSDPFHVGSGFGSIGSSLTGKRHYDFSGLYGPQYLYRTNDNNDAFVGALEFGPQKYRSDSVSNQFRSDSSWDYICRLNPETEFKIQRPIFEQQADSIYGDSDNTA